MIVGRHNFHLKSFTAKRYDRDSLTDFSQYVWVFKIIRSRLIGDITIMVRLKLRFGDKAVMD